MKLHIYAIRDAQAAAFMTPFFLTTQGQALRAFSDLANNQNHLVSKHPDDFKLYHLADWDDSTGIFELLDDQAYLATASDFAEKPIHAVKGA